MTCAAAPFPAVTALDRRAFAPARRSRRGRRGLAIALCTSAAAVVLAGTATLSAAWVVGICFGHDVQLQARSAIALEPGLPMRPYARLADTRDLPGLAGILSDAAGAPPTTAPRLAAKDGSRLEAEPLAAKDASRLEADPITTASLPAARAVSAAAAQLTPNRPAERTSEVAAASPSPSKSPASKPQRKSAAAAAKSALKRVAAAIISPHESTGFNLFDPAPMSATTLTYAPTDPPQRLADRVADRATDKPLPPARRPDSPRDQAQHDNAALAKKPALLKVADAGPISVAPASVAPAAVAPAAVAPAAVAAASVARAPAAPAAAPQRLALREMPDSPSALPGPDSHTALYDIEAHTVYLPSGLKLEAHSGLGSRLDDPRYFREKARGPTPPNVYDLKLREEVFHGVRAIRLNPVDDSKMFGRDGILAHTYMLGPTGQSFGCVSFKNYQQFLNAFLKGEVDRMVVVPRLETRISQDGRTRRPDGDRYAFDNR